MDMYSSLTELYLLNSNEVRFSHDDIKSSDVYQSTCLPSCNAIETITLTARRPIIITGDVYATILYNSVRKIVRGVLKYSE